MPTHRELADALRALAMDAAERDRPGHPGMPLVMADLAQVLWSDPCASIPVTRTGPIAIASCFPTATVQCCTALCCIRTGSTCRLGELEGLWRKYVGLDGEVSGVSGVGQSTPASIMFEHMGTNTTQVVDTVRRVLG